MTSLMDRLYEELEQQVMADAGVSVGDVVENIHGVFKVAGLDDSNVDSDFRLDQPVLNGYAFATGQPAKVLRAINPPWTRTQQDSAERSDTS